MTTRQNNMKTAMVKEKASKITPADKDNRISGADALLQCLIKEGVDTGTGADAVGAQGSIVMSNAMLYKGLLPNYDAGALTDLSGVISGQLLVLK